MTNYLVVVNNLHNNKTLSKKEKKKPSQSGPLTEVSEELEPRL